MRRLIMSRLIRIYVVRQSAFQLLHIKFFPVDSVFIKKDESFGAERVNVQDVDIR